MHFISAFPYHSQGSDLGITALSKNPYYMQILLQILKAASLLCRQFLHSSFGSIINSKTLLQKPAFVPLKHPNLSRLCLHTVSAPLLQLLFLHFSPADVITTSRLKKSGFFWTQPCYYFEPFPFDRAPSWFNDLCRHWPGRHKTQP